MRWLFILLIMCNGIYFLWQSYQQQGAGGAGALEQASRSAAGQQLTLLEEKNQPKKEVSATADPVLGSSESKEAVLSGKPVSQGRETTAVSSVHEALCWRIGPFKEEVSVKQVQSRLADEGIELAMQSIERVDKPDYWVHIPPQVSRREAIKLLRELQSKKIDSFLIGEGELENGISLGVFTQEPRAIKVLQERVGQGYPAKIKPIPRVRAELWALFDGRQFGELTDSLWQKISEGNQGLERRKNYCDKIASTDNID